MTIEQDTMAKIIPFPQRPPQPVPQEQAAKAAKATALQEAMRRHPSWIG